MLGLVAKLRAVVTVVQVVIRPAEGINDTPGVVEGVEGLLLRLDRGCIADKRGLVGGDDLARRQVVIDQRVRGVEQRGDGVARERIDVTAAMKLAWELER